MKMEAVADHYSIVDNVLFACRLVTEGLNGEQVCMCCDLRGQVAIVNCKYGDGNTASSSDKTRIDLNKV